MKVKITKSRVAIVLSGLEGFHEPEVRVEQYVTDSEIAAEVLWNAFLLGDLEGKVICDLGCGTGILGIGSLLLGAKNVFFVDSDEKSLKTAKMNIIKVKSEYSGMGDGSLMHSDINKVRLFADLVIQNPPFGTKLAHSDMKFLAKAAEIAPIVYSFHKSETKRHIMAYSAKNKLEITHLWDFNLPLKASYEFHRKRLHRINVSCFRFVRERLATDKIKQNIFKEALVLH